MRRLSVFGYCGLVANFDLSAPQTGKHGLDRPDVRRFTERLRQYRRQAENFSTELFRTVGAGLGRPPPRTARGLWGWLKKAGNPL